MQSISCADLVLQAIGFTSYLNFASIVVTGEGRLDKQTSEGKLVHAVSASCREAGVPCVAIVGSNTLELSHVHELGLADVIEAGTLEELVAAGLSLGGRARRAR